MNRVGIVDARLLGDIAAQLKLVGNSASPLPDLASLNAWLAQGGAAVLLLHQPSKSKQPVRAPDSRTKSAKIKSAEPSHWQLNMALQQLVAPDGAVIPLSCNECCVLHVFACAKGHLLSRKTLIEAMGHEFLCYDERRLEALISRLRRKLSVHAPEGFPVRGVKGRGYLFGVKVQEVAAEHWSGIVSIGQQ